MLGEYPVLVDGVETGKLCVSRDGLMTVFDARCKDPGNLLRLSVYGDREAYLGVMAPDGSGEVHLHRRLSRAALASFPEMIRFAAPAGMPIPAAEKNTDAEASKATDPEIEEAAGDDEEPLPQEESAAPQDVQWRHGAGGALIGICQDKRYLAIPLKSGVVPVAGQFEKRWISDAEYAVFEIKNGKII